MSVIKNRRVVQADVTSVKAWPRSLLGSIQWAPTWKVLIAERLGMKVVNAHDLVSMEIA